jgi:hydroxymethylbilane synthase
VVEIRGNVPTRLRKFDESDLDAMILAFAGVHRLGLDERITQAIPVEVMLPAVGQGAVAVEIRDADADVRDVVKTLDHMTTRVCVTAERAFLRTLEGGCQVPIGAHVTARDGTLTLQGFVGSLDGSRSLRDEITGSDLNAAALGKELAERLIAKGAAELVAGSRETGGAAGVI